MTDVKQEVETRRQRQEVRAEARATAQARPDGLTLAAFGLFVVLVAGNVVAIRFTNRELPPLWGAGTRFAAASLLFFLIVLARRTPLPRGRALTGTVLFGVLQFGLGFALGYWALLEVPAGLASVILASVPLFTLLFAYAARLEPLQLRAVAGALAAVGGFAVMFGERAGNDIPPAVLLATLGTAVIFALVPVVVKVFPPAPQASMNALAMLVGTVVLLAASAVAGESQVVPVELATWVAQLYLIIPGSVGVFALMLFLLQRWTASGVSFQAVLSPVAAIALSAWLLDESLTGGLLVGGVLTLVGVYFGALAGERNGG